MNSRLTETTETERDAAEGVAYSRLEGGRWTDVTGRVVGEGAVRLYVNGSELVTLMCSPVRLDLLALGFLRSEGVINDYADVRLLRVCPSGACVEVWLRRADVILPKQWQRTTGCGGVSFSDLTTAAAPLESTLRVSARQVQRMMGELIAAGQVHREVGGSHTSALTDGERFLAVAEDVGRHNTIDRLWGWCLTEKIATRDCILLTSGRISSDMLVKAARMGVPIMASRTSPTSLAVKLARAWRVTLLGYVRRESLNVYSERERITDDGEEQTYANS